MRSWVQSDPSNRVTPFTLLLITLISSNFRPYIFNPSFFIHLKQISPHSFILQFSTAGFTYGYFMVVSLFSPFDPLNSSLALMSPLLVLALIPVSSSFSLPSSFVLLQLQLTQALTTAFSPSQLTRPLTVLTLPSFFLLYFVNLTGLTPFTYSLTASLFFTVTLSLIL